MQDRNGAGRATGGALEMALRHPVLVLALLVALQTGFTLWSRDYWAFDEPRHADALRHLLEDGDWFSLHLNGAPYPDKPPVYFWLVAGAATLLGTDGPPAFFLVSAVGGFAFCLATWALVRAALPGRGRALALAAPILVLLTPLAQMLLRTTRMDLLFGAAIVFAEVLLWRGLRQEGPNRHVFLGLLVAGAAVLVKGPVGLLLPLAALVAFLVWTGRTRRLLARDVGLGLLAAAALVALWMLGIGLTEGGPYLGKLLHDQVFARAVENRKHAHGVWFYPAVLPGAWLPWTAVAATLSWGRFLGWRAFRERLARRKERSQDGRTWLWACFLAGLLALSLARSKLFIYLMPLLAPLAALTADWWTRIDAEARARATKTVAVMLLLLGAGIVVLPYLLPFAEVHFTAWHFAPAAVLLAGGIAGFARAPRRWAFAALALFLAYVGIALAVVPPFDAVMSPRPQAEALARYADDGYAPLVYKVYRGTYGYYARRVVPETHDIAVLAAHLDHHPKAVIATARKYLERHPRLLGRLRVVQSQRIEGQPHVLLIQRPPNDAPSADPAR